LGYNAGNDATAAAAKAWIAAKVAAGLPVRAGQLLTEVVGLPLVTAPNSKSTADYPVYTVTTDAFGNVSETWAQQKFDKIIAGQAKMTETTTKSTSTSIDGTTSITQPYKTLYNYNESTGKLMTVQVVAASSVPAAVTSTATRSTR